MKQLIFFLLYLNIALYGANHLTNESSPYLQQHKNNPVDWYPWTEEAFSKAKKENKLIFLSIGYSTCHWCHVMAREDFEDKEVAALLNRYFVSIKVDREEYPQIDKYYQKVYRMFNNRAGGWPLNIIMTSDKKPVFAGTYIPKYPSYGSKGLLQIIHDFTHISKNKLNNYGDDIITKMTLLDNIIPSKKVFSKKFITQALQSYQAIYDKQYKGFSFHPKFPNASMLLTLLHIYEISHKKEALVMVEEVLDAMAFGGIYDQIDGGFFRYCVDDQWQTPHFEKMLYTNAELIEVYTLAFKITKKPLYKKVVEDSIKNIDKKFLEDGIYKSASNAESLNQNKELEEGYYFLFKYDDTYKYLIQHNITPQDARVTLAYLGIEEDGNIDGESSNPHITSVLIPKNIVKIRSLLVQMRKKRTYPFIDYKRNTAWNALYITAKLKTRFINPAFAQEAIISLDALLEHNYKNGILYHISVSGKEVSKKGLLEDYAFVSQSLLQAYQITLNKRYLKLAKYFLREAKEKFYIDKKWYLSDDSLEVKATMDDGAYKSALATLMQSYLLVGSVDISSDFYILQRDALEKVSASLIKQTPYFSGAFDLYLKNYYGIYIIKSTKMNLLSMLYKQFEYPFVYLYISSSGKYEMCGIKNCYISTDSIKKIEEKLQEITIN